MKLLFITDNFPPEVNAPATRTYEHAIEWVKKGVEVTILTCHPNFPDGVIYKGYKNTFYHVEEIEGIKVIRVWSYMSSNKGFIKRILDYLSFALSAFLVGLFQKTDIIVATSPQFFTTWSAYALSKLKRKPWVFELRDIWPESIVSVGAIHNQKIINLLERIELGLYRDAWHIVAVTDAFKVNLESRGINGSKISVVTNGSNLSLFQQQAKDLDLIRQLKLEDKFIVGYIGTHGMAHGLDFIIESLAYVKDEKIHFLFVGNGAMKETIVKMAKHLALKNVTFLDAIPKEEVPKYLSICDISLAPLKRNDTFKNVIPSKIFEAAAMQKPTLLGVEGVAKGIISKYNAGRCFFPEDRADFIEKLMALRDEQTYQQCQRGCVALAKDFNREQLAQKMLRILQQSKVKQPKVKYTRI